MNRISTFTTFVVFARVAVERLINQCGAFKLPNLKKKDQTEADAKPRTATLHRAHKSSMFRRILGLWLPITSLLGLLMFSMNSIFAIINTVALKESMNDSVLRISAEHFGKLQNAIAIENETEKTAAIATALSDAFSSSVPWQADYGKKRASEHFEKHGIDGFKAINADEPSVGLVMTLSPQSRVDALRAVGLYLVILQMAILCASIGSLSKNLTSGDPDLTWLWQFPVSRSVLFSSKLIACVFNNPSIIVTWLYYAFIMWLCGKSFRVGLGVGILFGISTAVTVASLRIGIETFLVQKLSRATRGMLVGWIMGLGSICMLITMFGSNSQFAVEGFLELSRSFPQWISWNPFAAGIGTQAMMTESATWWMVTPAMSLVLAFMAVMSAVSMTRQGLSFSGESARTVRKAVSSRDSWAAGWMNAMMRKEFLQMRRQPEVIGQVVAAIGLVVLLMYLAGYQFLFDFVAGGGRNICVAILVGTTYMLMVAAPVIMRN